MERSIIVVCVDLLSVISFVPGTPEPHTAVLVIYIIVAAGYPGMYPVFGADCIILRFLGEKRRRGRAIISIWFCVLYGTDLPDPSGCVWDGSGRSGNQLKLCCGHVRLVSSVAFLIAIPAATVFTSSDLETCCRRGNAGSVGMKTIFVSTCILHLTGYNSSVGVSAQ